MTALAMTEVELIWRPAQIEHWLRFGAVCDEVRHDRRRRTVRLAAGAVFAVVRWSGGDYGTTSSNLDILRAVAPGQAFTTRPGVRPGAEVLAAFSGWARVQRGLAAIDAVEAAGFAPERIAPAYWGHVQNRLQSGQAPRAYDRARHRAWLLRLQAS